MIYVCGSGHGGPAVVGNTYLEGTYSEIYPEISQDEAGLRNLFKQFSILGGIPSHASPECPGSIREGGELGYSLSHSFGAVFDNPELIVACVVGDGEAETGPLATAWHSNKFLNPITLDVIVEPIHAIQHDVSVGGNSTRPRWPMIVLKSPKGWTGPRVVDSVQIEGTFRAHQIPLAVDAST